MSNIFKSNFSISMDSDILASSFLKELFSEVKTALLREMFSFCGAYIICSARVVMIIQYEQIQLAEGEDKCKSSSQDR